MVAEQRGMAWREEVCGELVERVRPRRQAAAAAATAAEAAAAGPASAMGPAAAAAAAAAEVHRRQRQRQRRQQRQATAHALTARRLLPVSLLTPPATNGMHHGMQRWRRTSSYTLAIVFWPLRYMFRISRNALYTRSSFWNRICRQDSSKQGTSKQTRCRRSVQTQTCACVLGRRAAAAAACRAAAPRWLAGPPACSQHALKQSESSSSEHACATDVCAWCGKCVHGCQGGGTWGARSNATGQMQQAGAGPDSPIHVRQVRQVTSRYFSCCTADQEGQRS